MTDENGETTLIGVVMADGDPPEIGTDNKVCHGTTAFGRVSNPDTLNWIKQNIESKVHIQVLKKIKERIKRSKILLYYIANYIILIIFFNMSRRSRVSNDSESRYTKTYINTTTWYK